MSVSVLGVAAALPGIGAGDAAHCPAMEVSAIAPPLTEGEEWVRAELGRLRARGFAPGAVAGFLAAAQRRANAIRRARPGLARREAAWLVAGAAAWLGLAAGGAEPFRRRLGPGLAWWAATGLMLDWHLGMLETADGEIRTLGPADALTLGRAWLVPVAADTPSAAVCALAGLTDVLDGRIARASAPTRAGRDLEGLVDACFAVAALGGAVRQGWLGRFAASAELARQGAGFAYALGVYFGRARPPDAAVARAARLTTPVRVAGLVAAGLGRRRAAGLLVGGGAAASVALLAGAARVERGGAAPLP
jgi:phosphatidylglycerophosphate synthase